MKRKEKMWRMGTKSAVVKELDGTHWWTGAGLEGEKKRKKRTHQLECKLRVSVFHVRNFKECLPVCETDWEEKKNLNRASFLRIYWCGKGNSKQTVCLFIYFKEEEEECWGGKNRRMQVGRQLYSRKIHKQGY